MILIIQSHFDHVRCPYRMALAPGGLLYVIARSQFTYGSLDKDFSMVIVFSDMSPKKFDQENFLTLSEVPLAI